jgi:energy-converting hydrogenase Eha subunit E
MFTTAFRFFAALSVAAVVGAIVSAVGSDTEQGWLDRVVGPITSGWKGGVGDHLAYTVLLSAAVIAGALAVLHVAFRDADPEAEAQVVHTDSVPLTRAPTGTNFLPLVAAFGVGVVLIGLITNKYVVIAGLIVLMAVIGTWTLRAWAERATGDDLVNTELYQRFIEPFRIPILSVLCIGVVAFGLSRVLLAVSEVGAVVVFIAVGTIFLFGAILLAARPTVTKNVITIVLFVGALVVIGAGTIAAVQGQREFEHEEEHEGVTPGGGEGSLGPGPIVVEVSSQGVPA